MPQQDLLHGQRNVVEYEVPADMLLRPNEHRSGLQVCLEHAEIVLNAPKLAQLVINPLRLPVFNVGQQSTIAAPAQPFLVEIGIECCALRADLDERLKAALACCHHGLLAFADKLLGFALLLLQFIQVMVIAMRGECANASCRKIDGFLVSRFSVDDLIVNFQRQAFVAPFVAARCHVPIPVGFVEQFVLLGL